MKNIVFAFLIGMMAFSTVSYAHEGHEGGASAEQHLKYVDTLHQAADKLKSSDKDLSDRVQEIADYHQKKADWMKNHKDNDKDKDDKK